MCYGCIDVCSNIKKSYIAFDAQVTVQDVPGICWNLLYWHEVHTQSLLLSHWTATSRQVTALLFSGGKSTTKGMKFPLVKENSENAQADGVEQWF